MGNKNIKIFRFLAGGLFAVSLLWSVIGTISASSLSWTTPLYWVSLAFMAAAMFSEKYVLLAIGAGLRIPGSLVSLFNNARSLFYAFGSYRWEFSDISATFCFLLNTLLSVAAVVLILMAVFKRDKAKNLGLLAVGLNGVGFLMYAIGYTTMAWEWYGVSIIITLFVSLLSEVLECVPIALAGHVMQSNVSQRAPLVQLSSVEVEDTSDRIEKIMKLKALLDSGIISQEEFDAKKKQILGL